MWLMRPLVFAAVAICAAISIAMVLSRTRPVSEDDACDILIRTASVYRLSPHGPMGHYYCDPAPLDEAHYVIGLRIKPLEDYGGSNLVGWFAVAKADGQVSEWDIGEGYVRALKAGPSCGSCHPPTGPPPLLLPRSGSSN